MAKSTMVIIAALVILAAVVALQVLELMAYSN